MTDPAEAARLMAADNMVWLRQLPNGDHIAIAPQCFTAALLVVEADYAAIAAEGHSNGWKRRFCYEKFVDAVKHGMAWDGESDPPGPWVKDKSPGRDRLNPALADPRFGEDE